MPLYQYKCTNDECNKEFEKIITKYEPDAPQPCPECGSVGTFYMPLRSRSGVKFLFNFMES